MTTLSPQQLQMQAPPLDKDYEYYSGDDNNNGGPSPPTQQQQQQPAPTTSTTLPRVKKGLGAMPMHPVEDYDQPSHTSSSSLSEQPSSRIVSPPSLRHQQYRGNHSLDPPAGTNPEDYPYGHDDVEEEEEEEKAPETMEGDEALLDLEQLEELHHEAERMKALGNKHMAAQEYTRAYNAYSAALQLSPVGPSSHVFLSNRSAALLSLKRYSAAATDARRAIALAPTFGKAHARLGQSLYFLKDYEGAVTAYEDAIHYEPDNPITRTYLDKAKTKLQRQKEKAMKNNGKGNGEEVSVLTAESSVQHTVVNSVATDPNASAAVVTTGFRGQSKAMMDAVGRDMTKNAATSMATTRALATIPPTLDEQGENTNEEYDDFDYDQDDPDFDEALRIQERANRYLANKNYKYAIEEYTAALFLVPDDENLSPELHLGRAHALNGSRRHESAKIDAQLAIKIKPTPEAYSTLAKSLFYMKDYEGSIEAFGKCRDMLPEGESLSMFDRAYLQKAEAALQELLEDGKMPPSQAKLNTAPIPKLRPPKFVSREEAINRTPNMPAMPKQWPQQSPRDNKIVKYGPEREVTFLSEALGIKLNRGPDGIVRVIEVSPDVAGSPIAREGTIEVGDVIREAAGVDIRRPITNIMWGDTVALIKMAPRPIVLVVAQEEKASIMDQRMQAAQNALSPTSAAHFFPSNSSTEEGVRKQMERKEEQEQSIQSTVTAEDEGAQETSELDEGIECMAIVDNVKSEDDKIIDSSETVDETAVKETNEDDKGTEIPPSRGKSLLDEDESEGDGLHDGKPVEDQEKIAIELNGLVEDKTSSSEKADDGQPNSNASDIDGAAPPAPTVDLREEELKIVGGEVLFLRNASISYNGWDNLRWMAFSGIRKVKACEPVYRYFEGRKGFLWNKNEYFPRRLAIYEHPRVILILREAENIAEFKELMELPGDAEVDPTDLRSHLFVESLIDPKTAKLRLSPLTTMTSVLPDVPLDDVRRRSAFELINPIESAILSAVRVRGGAESSLTSFTDSGAFLEISGVEYAVIKAICNAHSLSEDTDEVQSDLSWKHQIILGTLHSYVVIGNQKFLDMAIDGALSRIDGRDSQNPNLLSPRIVDAVDESGRTALHYACKNRFSSAVLSLVKAGADVNLRVDPDNIHPCHLCAQNLDYKSLAVILESSRRPNVTDALGRTPLCLVITEGKTVGGQSSPEHLENCISVLEKYGGEVGESMGYRHPVSHLASVWRAEDLEAVLRHCKYRYPLRLTRGEDPGISIGALYQYPVHSALLPLRNVLGGSIEANRGKNRADFDVDKECIKTLEALFSCGFEPNERIEGIVETFPEKDDLLSHIGFAPIQIVALCALDMLKQKETLGDAAYSNINRQLVNITGFMVQNGARLSIDAPPLTRSGEKRHSNQSSITAEFTTADDTEARAESTSVPRSDLKIQANRELTSILGTSFVLEGQKFYKSLKPAQATSSTIFHTDKLTIENSPAPGGSDDKSCAICWKLFGMLVRKHRCRVSRRFVCDECSSQRIVGSGEEHRVSDGQFLLAKAEEKNAQKATHRAAKFENSSNSSQTQQCQHHNAAAARLDRLEAEENANRDSLFGGIVASVTKSLVGIEEEDTNQMTQADNISGLSSQLNQTRDALNERGDKLNALADKSDKLVNASRDFEAMAKELNRKSNQGLFSW